MTIQCFTNLLDTNYLKLQQSLKRVSVIISAISAIGFEQESIEIAVTCYIFKIMAHKRKF